MIKVYSDLYYKPNFAEQVRKEVEETTPNYPKSKQECSAQKMSIYRRWHETSWDAEDDEVKAHVCQVYDDEHNDDEEVDDGDNPSDDIEWGEDLMSAKVTLSFITTGISFLTYAWVIFSCIDVLGDVITNYLKDLNASTGFAPHLFAGGLDSKGEVVFAM